MASCTSRLLCWALMARKRQSSPGPAPHRTAHLHRLLSPQRTYALHSEGEIQESHRPVDQEDGEGAHRKKLEGVDITEKQGRLQKTLRQPVPERQMARSCLVLSKPSRISRLKFCKVKKYWMGSRAPYQWKYLLHKREELRSDFQHPWNSTVVPSFQASTGEGQRGTHGAHCTA